MNKTGLNPIFVCVSLVMLISAGTGLPQGSLYPPGAPAPTMHTMSEVYDEAAAAKDSRAPIHASDLPLTITTPGSYYLVENIDFTTTDTHGITIDCDDVAIDLNGFTLRGPGKSAGDTGSGIYVVSNAPVPFIVHRNITIRNGSLKNWRENGARGSVSDNRFEALQCYDNGEYGIVANTRSIVRNTICSNNGSSGIGTSDGCVISGNTAHDNGSSGINGGNHCYITGNVCAGNTQYGIRALSGTVTKNICRGNNGSGIYVMAVALVSDNVSVSNGASGIFAYSGSSHIVNNMCQYNGTDNPDAAGIGVLGSDSCIEDNVVIGNKKGISCSASGNIIEHNRASGNDTDYDIAPGNRTFFGDRENVSF